MIFFLLTWVSAVLFDFKIASAELFYPSDRLHAAIPFAHTNPGMKASALRSSFLSQLPPEYGGEGNVFFENTAQ